MLALFVLAGVILWATDRLIVSVNAQGRAVPRA